MWKRRGRKQKHGCVVVGEFSVDLFAAQVVMLRKSLVAYVYSGASRVKSKF